MSQNYTEVPAEETLSVSRTTLNRNFDALKTNFSGTAFPTLDIKVGQTCYREDLEQLYILRSIDPVTVWSIMAKPAQVFIGRTDADARYHRLGQFARASLGLQSAGADTQDTQAISFAQNDGYTRWQMGFDTNKNFFLNRYDSTGILLDQPIAVVSGVLKTRNYTVFHTGNMGSGSGLSADTLRGTAPSSIGLSLLSAADTAAAQVALGFDANSQAITGDVKASFASAINGWILLVGYTIGNASSGATYAGSVYQALFVAMYSNAPFSPVSGGRTGNALNDFNAGKRLTLPDARGRALFMTDGGYNYIPNSSISFGNNNTMGSYGGYGMVTLSTAEMPYHYHTMDTQGYHVHYYYQAIGDAYELGSGLNGTSGFNSYQFVASGGEGYHYHNISYSGGGQAHHNMPPYLIVNYFVKI